MLDPLSALSVAAATVAFVDFGYKLVSETKRTYTDASGATKENVSPFFALLALFEDSSWSST